MSKQSRIRYQRFKEVIEQTGKTYLTLSDIKKFYTHQKESLRVLLSQWKKQGLIFQLSRGMYTFNLASVDYLQLATTLYPNSYISFEYALQLHGVIHEVPAVITVATSSRSRRLRAEPYMLEYTHLKKELIFGYELRNKAYIATPEKALADILYVMARGQRITELDSIDWRNIDKKKLKKIIQQYPPYVLQY